jgi:NAD dependent epimerase/dehydratase
MHVLVTGAGGFIGSHVVEALITAGHRVRGVVNYNSRSDIGLLREVDADVLACTEIRRLDIRDHEAVHAACKGVDAIVHLAALIGIPYSYTAPESYVTVNVMGTLNLLNGARRYDVGYFLHTSTSEVYGSAQYTPIDERHPLVGQSPYSASKIAADKMVESYALSFELPSIIIRPFNTYGPRQSIRAVIPTLAAQLLDDDAGVVYAGTVTTVRDFTFVTDTAGAFVCALAQNGLRMGQVVNLGTGAGRSVESVFEMLQEITGIRKRLCVKPERIRPAHSEVHELIADNSKAREALGWWPRVPFDEGLRRVVEYLALRPPVQAQTYGV